MEIGKKIPWNIDDTNFEATEKCCNTGPKNQCENSTIIPMFIHFLQFSCLPFIMYVTVVHFPHIIKYL